LIVVLVDVESLADEVRLNHHSLVRLAGALHGALKVTAPMRAVLEFLHAWGPTPVPGIARSRGVSRQHIQTIVNELLVEGLVELRDNPAHRRSCLVALTAAGDATIAGIRDTERTVLGDTFSDLDAAAVLSATETLRAVRRRIDDIIDGLIDGVSDNVEEP
jgi:DNA-binding MarR family transcriptional regulator